jgi:hypothetical protein
LQEFNPSKRINTDEPFYCEYWKKEVIKTICNSCPNYLRKTCVLVLENGEQIMRDCSFEEKLNILKESIKKEKEQRDKESW